MPFMNATGSIGLILAAGTLGVNGSLFLTLLMVLMFLIVIGIMFQIPLEFISIIVLPMCLACASYYSNFVAPVAVIFIYVATLITKRWLFN